MQSDRLEILDRLECLDRPDFCERSECLDILEYLDIKYPISVMESYRVGGWWVYLDYSVSSGPFLRFTMSFEFLSEMFDHSM